jgi:hypothetical protein
MLGPTPISFFRLDYFRDKILATLIFTMKSLYSPDTDEQQRGVYIITALEKHGHWLSIHSWVIADILLISHSGSCA